MLDRILLRVPIAVARSVIEIDDVSGVDASLVERHMIVANAALRFARKVRA